MSLLTKDQALATNPEHSVFVAASAGTGKTHVLTARVLRMMVRGTRPDHILCLTYTKAAAANMANRIYAILGDWALARAEELPAKINAITGEKPDAKMLDFARTLFATVLEIPGGLKIQTIHSFCQSLLVRFPIEAGLAPHFTVMDERTAGEFLKDASETVMDAAGEPGREELTRAFDHLARRTTEDGFNDALKSFLVKRGAIQAALRAHGGPEGLIKAVRKALGIAPGDTRQGILRNALDEKNFEAGGLKAMRDILLQGSVSENRQGENLKTFFENLANPALAFGDLTKVFFTASGDPRKPFFVKKTLGNHPEIFDIFSAEQTRLMAVREKLALVEASENTAALVRLGATILELYQQMKARHGYLDYDDLILFTAGLLEKEGIAPWILYKLDGGIDHILVDEAQDTNKIQWTLVETLADEFFAGFGGREELIRTVFAVGDIKQSIYGFQGAEPEEFHIAREKIKIKVEEAGLVFKARDLTKSFRATQVVLDIVDEVFALKYTRDGVGAEGEVIRHIASRAKMAGLVEVWPPETPGQDDTPAPGWKLPFEQGFGDRPEVRLAEKIAGHIEGLVDSGENLEARGRPIRYGDILVLVQKRDPFMEPLIRELKARHIPVTGSDRMKLSEQVAIEDLITLARFALLPGDDFSLAVILKSPLLGLDDDDLMALAIDRKGTLWQALTGSRKYAAATEYLKAVLAMADQVTPFEFFSEILGPRGGRKAFIRRLGPEVNDPLDEFLALALGFERLSTPSLQGFLHWFQAGETEIKRDMERGSNEVRVMTVHGAKGLEAPVVYLPDTFRGPAKQTASILEVEPDLMVWPGLRENEKGLLEAARAKLMAEEAAERNRLLYVALTRAADRLYVGGWKSKNQSKEPVWYDAIFEAVSNFEGVEKIPGPGGEILRLKTPQEATPEKDLETLNEAGREAALPDWTGRIFEKPEPGLEALQPSKAEGGLAVVPGEFDEGRKKAIRRGTVIHKLLEVLPGIAPDKRDQVMQAYLKTPAHGLATKGQGEIAAKVSAILGDPDFGVLFAPGSRAELGVFGVVDGRAASGQVDRVAITDKEIFIVDYKSNKNVPAKIDKVPGAYIRQLSLYARLLAAIYPGRKVRAALLWTETGTWMEIAQENLIGLAS